MQILNKALSLLDYIGNDTQSKNVLDELAKNQTSNVGAGIKVLDIGLSNNRFEDTLTLLEKGEIDVDLKTVENYFQFNKDKLSRELTKLAKQFSADASTTLTLKDGAILVNGDNENHETLQQYVDKDTRLNNLIQQTSKLSQFLEWGKAKQQAAIYKDNDVDENQLVEFLKEARKVVTSENTFLISTKGVIFSSEDKTQSLIEQFSEENKTTS